MYFVKSFVALAAAIALASATPGVDRRAVCYLVPRVEERSLTEAVSRRLVSSSARAGTTAKITSAIASRTVNPICQPLEVVH